MKLDTLIRRITAHFQRHAARYGLNPETVETRYILNWGGFVNASFFIKDGQKTLHLKLALDEDNLACLDHWMQVRELLTSRYHAPRILDWVEIPRTPFAGLLSEYIPGKPVDFQARPEVLEAVLALLPRLHNDADLAQALRGMGDTETSCADYFLAVYIDRFDEDLLGIINELPPFVPLDLYDWMMSETRELEGLVRDLPAFQHPAAAPTHGDLWASNILVTQTGDWTIIDWDDLTLGDPALDYSILLGPLWRSGTLTAEQAANRLPPGDPALRERFLLCLRALLLDQVIDPLADWVEGQFAPEHLEEVRAGKEKDHQAALTQYRQWFGSA